MFSSAVLFALLAALLPTAATADDTPAPTDPPVADETAAPEIVVPDNSVPDSSVPETEAPDPQVDGAEVDDATAAIPTPEDGDYIGSNTPDDADPGAYSQAEGEQLHAMGTKGFRAGNIISDAKLYTSGTMTAKQLQYFFDQKVPRCDPNYTCLKDFSMPTRTKTPNAYCSGTYQGASNDTAAQIISKVSKACKVSEKALVVMLQKEQGLVTHTWPSDFRYDIAMGYACPDDAPCDEQYFGFQNQMYMAAYQLQRYSKDDYFSWYPVGKSSLVRWHPNASCGSGPVFIENKATAALYYYTPYQPNKAALAAGYGIGDACSAYGNRNFYNYYTDWFGSTHGGDDSGDGPSRYPVQGPIGEKWRALGGANGKLGSATSAQRCGLADEGCFQDFAGGKIHWSKASGAHYTLGAIRSRWKALGWENGYLGYPTTDERCGLAGGGCYQQFQGGKVYWKSGLGARPIRGAIMDRYKALRNERGLLGYPTSGPKCVLKRHDGCYQDFEGGKIHWSRETGAHYTTGAIRSRWKALGWENGLLGFPTSDEKCVLKRHDGCYQDFEGGKIHWSRETGAHYTTGAIRSRWKALGWENGYLGYPVTDERCGLVAGGCYQQFEGGKVYWKKRVGAHALRGAIMNRYQSLGNEHSRLGFPIAEMACRSGRTLCSQAFEGGEVTWKRGFGTTVRYWLRAV